MTVLIPLETANRELLYKAFLSHMLALRGMTVYLGSKRSIRYLMHKFTNYIYLDKGYHQNRSEEIYDLVNSRKGTIVSLDEEGAIDFSDNRTLKKRYGPNLFQSVEKVFFWGRYQHNMITESIKMNSDIIISGHPRFELLKPPYHSFYEKEKTHILNNYGNFILVNTNMGFGNNIRGDEFVRDGYGKWFDNIEDIILFDKAKLDIYGKLVNNLLNLYKGKIVLRPHPEEDIKYYRQFAQGNPRFHIISKGSVIPWILASEAMIHPDCTTAIETLILGKKPISFLPTIHNEDVVTKLPVQISYKVTKLREIEPLLGKLNEISKLITPADTRLLEEYFSLSVDSSELICNEIVDVSKRMKKSINGSLLLWDRLYLRYRDYKQQRIKNENALLIQNKLKGFNWHELLQMNEKFIDILSELRNIKIIQISPKLFRFSRGQF